MSLKPTSPTAPDAAELHDEIGRIGQALGVPASDPGAVRRAVEQQLALERRQAYDQAMLAAIPQARLLSRSVQLHGRSTDRLRVARHYVGGDVAQPFSPFCGVTRCATEASDVRELWARLLAFEAACDDTLRGHPSTVLDVPGGVAAIRDGALHVTAGPRPVEAGRIIGIPRFLYDAPERKLTNFGHWLLDCAPQIVALSQVEPRATFLMPQKVRRFHYATLERFGVAPAQLQPWDGEPIPAARLLISENDGRTRGGRPLSPLEEARRRVGADQLDARRLTRRIYVSRRDAGKRQWVSNEPLVEDLFRARGFEVVTMSECPLDEQVRLFQDARIIAGPSGAGLSDLVFSAAGIDVIVLLTDSLIRWYAEGTGARSHWAAGNRAGAGQLAALADSPRFYPHLAAAFGQRCHPFVGSDELPIPALTAFLDDVLAEVAR